MSTTSIAGIGSESSMASHLNVATLKRDNVRQTLESFQSQSNSLFSLAFQWKDLENEFNSIVDSIAKREEQIKLKLQQIEWKQKYLKKKSNEMDSKVKKLEESLNDRCKEVDATYELVARCYKVVKDREERLRELNCHLRRKFLKKEMKLDLMELLVDNRDHELNSREKKLGVIERNLLERLEEAKSIEKRLNERVSEIERRERLLEVKEEPFQDHNHVMVKKEPWCDYDDDDGMLIDSSYADLRLNVTMDGRALQMFLNGRVKDHEILRDEVIAGLRLSADPAKLVLDAIQGFYPEDLGDVDIDFDLNVVRKSCILLLEQLIKMKPRIKSHLKERAMKIAMEWKERMEVDDDEHYLEVVGFLQLVATYGLTCAFGKDELLVLFKSCVRHDQAPELCRSLGFTDDIHDIIQNLILRHQPFDAIRLAYAFELVDIFPPVPILKSHLSFTFSKAEKLYKNGDPPIEAQIKCTSAKLAALISVVRCIKKYGLESKYPIQPLEQLISELKRQKKKGNASLPTSKSNDPQIKIQDEELCFALTPVSSSVKQTTDLTPMDPGLARGSPKSAHIPTEPLDTGRSSNNRPSCHNECRVYS